MRHRPLLVCAAAFAAGIGVGAAGWLPLPVAFGLAALGLVLLAAGRSPALFLAGLIVLGVSAGALRLAAFGTVPASDVSHFADQAAPVTLTGTVISDPEARRGGRITLFLRAEQIEFRRQTAAVTGDVSVTLGPAARRRAFRWITATGWRWKGHWKRRRARPTPARFPGGIIWPGGPSYCELRVKRRRRPWRSAAQAG